MKKIKVLQLVEELRVGGAEKVIRDITLGFDPGKYVVSVWCLSGEGEIAHELRGKGVEVKALGITSYYNPLNIIALAVLLRQARPDVLHTHTYFSNTIGRLAGKIAAVPVIITHVHNTYYQYTPRNLFIERLLSGITDKIITCSEAVRDFVIKEEKVLPGKVVTVYNGIESQKYEGVFETKALKISLGINPNDKVLVTVASLTPKKGHKYLLDAAPEVIKAHGSVKFVFVGDGPLRKELKEQAVNLGILDHVVFAGVRNDIAELLAASDIFVLPSVMEGLGLAAIEAMASGIAVVATNVGGLPEVVENNVSGILVHPKDPAAIAEAIKVLLENRGTAKNMGTEGRRIATEKFSLDTMVKELEALYDECLDAKIKTKIRVLYVHNKAQISGGERSLLNLWQNLDRSRVKPYVVLPAEGSFSVEAKRFGVDELFLEVPKLSLFNLFKICKAIFVLGLHVQKKRINIMHSYTPRNNIISSVVGKILGVRVIWHERNLIFGKEMDLTRRFIFLPDAVICNSRAVAERFGKDGVIPSKVKVILNGVDLKWFDPGMSVKDARRELGAGERKIVGIITNLNKRKRPEYFLEAASRVFNRYKDVFFVIVGGEFSDSETGRMSELKAMAVELGLKNNLVFTGFKEDVVPLLAAFDISVQVTEKEACSRAIIESMAAGKPVIAVGGGGNPELIDDGVTGVLVAPDDPEGLADEILGLLQNDARRSEMGRKGRERAERSFDVKRNAKETEEIYNELTAKNTCKGRNV